MTTFFVRKGYTFFIGDNRNKPVLGGEKVEVSEEDFKKQGWKLAEYEEKAILDRKEIKNKMVESSTPVKKVMA